MKTLSFVIPMYNEQFRLTKTMAALNSFEKPKGITLSEVIFVNDGSTDETLMLLNRAKTTILRRFRKKFPKTTIQIVTYRNNYGKGFAIKQGMLKATGDYTLFFDADMSTPLTEVAKLVPFMKQEKDVIIGTRKNGKSTVIMHQPLLRESLGKVFTKLAQTVLQVEVTDFTCGFKAFSSKARKAIFSKSQIATWGYDGEIMYLTKKYRLSFSEKAVLWSNDPNTKVRMFQAIPKTLSDLFMVYWYHEIQPRTITLRPLVVSHLQQLPIAGRITALFL